jgi:hypothetical protein
MSLWWILFVVVVIGLAFITRPLTKPAASRWQQPSPHPRARLGAPPLDQEPSAPPCRASSALVRQAPSERPPVECKPIDRPCDEPAESPEVVEPREPPRKILRIELIPYPMGGKNARAVLTGPAWREVRNIVHALHAGRCGECGKYLPKKKSECHEVWKYDWVIRQSKAVPVMKLVELRSLCRRCHQGKHYKFVESQQADQLPEVRRHLLELYGLTEEQLDRLVTEAVETVKRLRTWKERELDLTHLNHERFVKIHELMGREFGANELQWCTKPRKGEDLAA